MLNENIKALRKAKGLSQESFSLQLNVVRQTVSKWERGLSVPDSELLIAIAKVLEVPVSTLLGPNIELTQQDDLKLLSEKLETLNQQLAQNQITKRKRIQNLLIGICGLIIGCTIILFLLDNAYLNWIQQGFEYMVIGTLVHGFAWAFVRISPFVFVGALLGIVWLKQR